MERRIRPAPDDVARSPDPDPDLALAVRLAEAVIFAARDPVPPDALAGRLPAGTDVAAVIDALRRRYRDGGVVLARAAGGYAFRTAPDLAQVLAGDAPEPRRLSRAALETLAIVAYHQPVTRAEIEEIRGVSTSKGSLDVLLESGWVRLRGRRKTPGRPVTFGTTPAFLEQFGLDAVGDLPGLEELRGSGFLEGVQGNLFVPQPSDETTLRDDEEPLGNDASDDGPLEGETGETP